MAPSRAPSVQFLRSLRCLDISPQATTTTRTFASSCRQHEEQAQLQRDSFYKNPKPETAFVPRLERKLVAAGTPPVGSRRRRMAIAQSQGVPFDQLPYQCFQEARKILIADREEKLAQIEVMRARIARLQGIDAAAQPGGEVQKQKRIDSMARELQHLKILADSNDPNVKRRFEDGKGDMSKPIYRFLADRKWREYRRMILVQRLTQLNVVPDVLPHCDPTLDIKMHFGRSSVQPGDFVDSAVSEKPCRLTIQSFEKDAKLVTIAIVDSDVPNLETDAFDSRCHFLATNIQITHSTPIVDLAKLSEEQVLIPYLPPTAQKGSSYHRLSIVVLQQKGNIPIDKAVALKNIHQHNFKTRSFLTRHMLEPVGATLFRIKWDENMADVMNRAGIEGAETELKRKKVEPLPYKRRNSPNFR